MRIVYMGTPAIAVPPMKAIKDAGHEVVAVVSQPDRPKGRGRALAASEVKEAALAMGLFVIQPEKASDEGFFEQLRALSPDVAVVMAYGQKIPSRMLAVPKHGFINIHASVLPEYRGAAPVQRAIMDGRDMTGVTIMYMSEGMDEGDIGLVRRIPILPEDDAGSVLDKVSSAGAELVVEMLRLLDMGKAPRVPQDHRFASLARKITRKDESIDWGWSSKRVVDHVRPFRLRQERGLPFSATRSRSARQGRWMRPRRQGWGSPIRIPGQRLPWRTAQYMWLRQTAGWSWCLSGPPGEGRWNAGPSPGAGGWLAIRGSNEGPLIEVIACISVSTGR
ncbi:MAG TPA: methionyl-tRNA formyltransferase [Bacillota bacterium]|nr:methionyl-tRNA formyltransferase [Bacillota bacterium]